MTWHIIKNRFKILLRNKTLIFWTLMFPIILVTFFQMAFSGIIKGEMMTTIPIAIVENKENTHFKDVIEELKDEDDKKLFEVNYLTKKEANKKLSDKKIDAYVVIDDEITIVVEENGINQTITKYTVDTYLRKVQTATNLSANPSAVRKSIMQELDRNENYLKSINKEDNLDYTLIMFYTLIGMVCMYGGTFGILSINETEANLSTKGARVSVAPTHKLNLLFSSLLVSIVIQYTEILILMAYMILILGVTMVNLPLILLLTFIGSVLGITVGSFIGVLSKKSEDTKIGILIAISMLCSFLAGMMSPDIKYIIDKNVGFISRINPVGIITDALYSLYYYDTLNRFYFNILNLLILTTILITIMYFFVRRKKYDSI